YGVQLGLGGYLVGGGSVFIALCYFLPRERLFAFVAFAALILAGKRGPLVAGLVVMLIHFTFPHLQQVRQSISFSTLFSVGIAVIAAALVFVWVRPDVIDAVGRHITERTDSILPALFGDEDVRTTAAGGRYEEIDAITAGFTTSDWLFGRGFGYSIWSLEEEE